MSILMTCVTVGHYGSMVIHEYLVDGIRRAKLGNRTKHTAKLQYFVRVGRLADPK